MEAALGNILIGSMAPTAAVGSAAGIGAGLGASSLALGAQAAGPIFGAFSTMNQMSSLRAQERQNVEIAKTRADQTDAAARSGLESDLSSFRAAFSANDARPSVATLGILNSVREMRERDRRIALGNERLRQSAAANRASSYRPGIALANGMARAAPSIFQFYGSLS
jgi:hypothetical protein